MTNPNTKKVTIGGKSFLLYGITKRQRSGANSMARLISQHGASRFWQPAPDKAPWHVKAIICDVDCDFWYTKGKASFNGIMKFGWTQIGQEIRRIIQEGEDDAFDVLEDD